MGSARCLTWGDAEVNDCGLGSLVLSRLGCLAPADA